MNTATGRTQKCGRAQARTRLAHARKFLAAAQLAADEDAPESSSVAASLAVLCGIAAADAACCAALGVAPDLKTTETPSCSSQPSSRAEKMPRTRCGDSSTSRTPPTTGLINVSRRKLTAALRQASTLVEFAGATIRR